MGAYNFKPQFEAPIMADDKRHAIRAKRKDGRRPKVGEVLSLYVGMCTRACRLLKRRRCVRVQEIRLFYDPTIDFARCLPQVEIDGIRLNRAECGLLAVSDGFRDYSKMADFWDGRLPFSGDLIHWESDAEAAKNPIPDPKPKRPVRERRANTRRARKSPKLKGSANANLD